MLNSKLFLEMTTLRLIWGGTSRIVKPFALKFVRSFCHGLQRHRGKFLVGITITSLQSTEISNLKRDSTEKKINILSFDGGGSRGVMEIKILDDVLRLATIVLRNPETLNYLTNKDNDESIVNLLEGRAVRERLIKDMEAVEDPIHPTDVYDMIVGTSIGGLIAFSLVGGNKVGNDHHARERMTINECIQIYHAKAKDIFRKSWLQWLISPASWFFNIPLVAYSKDNVEKILHEQFGDCYLSDFSGEDLSKPVAGVVARRLGKKEGLVLFDTASEDYWNYKAKEVLLATSNAPVYFDTPVKIGDEYFVDGGIGGNCPLIKAIGRAIKIFASENNSARIVSALSIAPPPSLCPEVSNNGTLLSWLHYFVNLSTDASAVFEDVAANSNWKDILFQRLLPRGEILMGFKFDEDDTQKMIDAMEKVKLDNELFLLDVVASAMFVVLTFLEKKLESPHTSLSVAAHLSKAAGRAYQSRKDYDSAIVSYKVGQQLQRKVSDSCAVFKFPFDIAKCHKEKGEYLQAIRLFEANIKDLDEYRDDSKYDHSSYDDLIVDNLIEKSGCYLQNFHYHDAEKCLEKISDDKFGCEKKRIQVLINKAYCKQKQGSFEEAVNLYNELDKFTLDNIEKAEKLNNIGLAFLDVGMKNDALVYVRQAQDLRKSEEKCNPHLVAESHNNVGLCLVENGNYSDALESLEEARRMVVEKCMDQDMIKISHVFKNLAKYYFLKDPPNYDEALKYAQKALENRKKEVLRYDNPGIATIRLIMGNCQFKVGKPEEAEKNLLKASSIIESLLSESHPQLAEIYDALSQLYEKKGDPKLAKEYEKKKTIICDKLGKIQETMKKITCKS
ncbi:uncharacterized protein LOC124434762 [Xenia sp. Carnegie-2017]|uniref:uncharacterized protein LOC124434762 n=1 Tax=Xenia sp. Carnegie-2017 TaxID=2897299 RepID=UPI001F037C8D|nr:uncharacterized protein LOC124434762 [Xenia sp. Carnegie-2017]XP_046840614.1 uncharacterized protein LOC124434762 [Xenia sp. Carnegie-2017]XP_046840615.1 uncharacterized protein LOC124434762 [Xenia sp. Carnegie-2017]XP_046840616.1 uncharacterized protein LOC124434762 [Xenia sp. Carnegie-2017]XP_046840618.1 uncharacterized protein LOC124434762 [Xenia sp. Carnegie-2017]XP_046840619.1 uncharacterized protein LOC124434762 [Xenia sp. Carnegie-2017]